MTDYIIFQEKSVNFPWLAPKQTTEEYNVVYEFKSADGRSGLIGTSTTIDGLAKNLALGYIDDFNIDAGLDTFPIYFTDDRITTLPAPVAEKDTLRIPVRAEDIELFIRRYQEYRHSRNCGKVK